MGNGGIEQATFNFVLSLLDYSRGRKRKHYESLIRKNFFHYY